MKLVTFLSKPYRRTDKPNDYAWNRAAQARWGVWIDNDVFDFTSKKVPTLLHLIEAGPSAWKQLGSAVRLKKNKSQRVAGRVPVSRLTLLSPIPRPPSMRDFLAFEEHSSWSWKKRGLDLPPEWYEMPVYYKGNHRTLWGPGDTIRWPSFTQKLDYELELTMVLGRSGVNIKKEKALDHIFGYAIMNDWSARDIQAKEMLCRLGPAKGKDFGTSIGPCIVTKDELGDANGLRMQAFINDQCWSDGNSATRHWSFSDMIAHVSRDEPVFAGDLYGSGTVGRGCGLELDRWLTPGDTVTLKIEGIGELQNRVGAKP
ncbi:MAG TPA: fumarylacetoacetate hydrolase family protein [Oligoflexia bacterium]|nr:fumarylacetoacetate hydrolase family protein [Oligoflexia bacterium]